MRDLVAGAEIGSAYAKLAADIKAMQVPAVAIAENYRNLTDDAFKATQTINTWYSAQKAQQESVRRMLDQVGRTYRDIARDDSTQRIFKELAAGGFGQQWKQLQDQAIFATKSADIWAKQAQDAKTLAEKSFGFGGSAAVQKLLSDIGRTNKTWQIPKTYIDAWSLSNGLQDQLRKLTLPAIDWNSAATLAKLLGQEGIDSQLAHIGVAPDGTLKEPEGDSEKGILSRNQADLLTLLAFLLTVLIFAYQEYNDWAQEAKTEAFQKQALEKLDQQAQQIRSLEVLVMKLAEAPKLAVEYFMVRERPATVRSEPQSGSSVEGMLLPNEVVRLLDKQGKWIEVEYYHWLHEEYRTGWVLKKYLQRVPPNSSATQNQ